MFGTAGVEEGEGGTSTGVEEGEGLVQGCSVMLGWRRGREREGLVQGYSVLLGERGGRRGG